MRTPAQQREEALRRREILRGQLAARWGGRVWLLRLGPFGARYEVAGRRGDGSRSDGGTAGWLLRRAALPLTLLAGTAPDRHYVVRGAEGSGAVCAADALPTDTLGDVWLAGTAVHTGLCTVDTAGAPEERYGAGGAHRPVLDGWTLRWPDGSSLELGFARGYAENVDQGGGDVRH